MHGRNTRGGVVAMMILALALPAAQADLVGYWQFNEGTGTTAADSSGQGNTGSLTNMDGSEWEAGHTGAPGDSALHFDGSNDFVNVPDSTSVSVRRDLALSAWVNLDAHSNSQKNIVAKSENNSYRWRLTGHATDPNEQWLLINDGTGHEVHFDGGAPTAGNWHHMAATVDFTERRVRFYVDGALTLAEDTSKTHIADHGAPLRLGAYDGGGGESFDGLLDDIAVYGRWLSSDQIASLATGAAPASFAGAAPGKIRFLPITGDADSGISTEKTYTHTLDPGTGPLATVNGVPFTRITANPASYPANFNYEPSSNRRDHSGNSNTGVPGSDDVHDLLTDMIYEYPPPDDGIARVTLSGLIPGVQYDARIYTRRWGGDNRPATVRFNHDGGTVPENQVLINEDDATQDPPGFADTNQAYALSYTYEPRSTRLEVEFEQHRAGASWHLYGVTNEFVRPTTNLHAKITGDDSYDFFITGAPGVTGLPVGSGSGWETPEEFDVTVPVGEPLWLHIKGYNGFDHGGDWAGIVGQFELPKGHFFVGTDFESMLTTTSAWMGNELDFGSALGPVTSITAYGGSPWGTTPGAFDPSAEWIWYGDPRLGQGGETYSPVYLSMPFQVFTPEPGTLTLLAFGGAGLLARRRRRRRA